MKKKIKKIKYLPEKWQHREAICDFCYKEKKNCIGVKYSNVDICFDCLDRLFNSILT